VYPRGCEKKSGQVNPYTPRPEHLISLSGLFEEFRAAMRWMDGVLSLKGLSYAAIYHLNRHMELKS
jgi:hypothetical protein